MSAPPCMALDPGPPGVRWIHGMAVRAWGTAVGVRTDDPETARRLRELLLPGWTPAAGEVDHLYSVARCGRHLSLYDGPDLALETVDHDRVLSEIDRTLHVRIGERAPAHVFLHAGVVGWRGRAVLLPGRTLAGKSTLVRELVAAGADYYSDDVAVLDDGGRVHAYPLPLKLRDGGVRGRTLDPVRLGWRPGLPALPVGLVLLVRYRAGARLSLRPLTPGTGALALFEHAIPARSRPGEALSLLADVASEARVLAGERGGVAEVLRWLTA